MEWLGYVACFIVTQMPSCLEMCNPLGSHNSTTVTSCGVLRQSPLKRKREIKDTVLILAVACCLSAGDLDSQEDRCVFCASCKAVYCRRRLLMFWSFPKETSGLSLPSGSLTPGWWVSETPRLWLPEDFCFETE